MIINARLLAAEVVIGRASSYNIFALPVLGG
jgi:hypothetical protein